MVYEYVQPFRELFQGYTEAFGHGGGGWVKRPLRPDDWLAHLEGRGDGIGIGPLRPDNTVMFAAIDLDEPDFDLARRMQRFIPGPSFIERSRSGNAHVWVFFDAPCPAWLAMGVLRAATVAVDRKDVEVFPKNHDFARVQFGNYINLPYHGESRPIVQPRLDGGVLPRPSGVPVPLDELPLSMFLERVKDSKISPAAWERRADLMQIYPPSERGPQAEWGTQEHLHSCAERVLSGEAGPILEGTRNQVFFMLAKCLLNWKSCDEDEALEMLLAVNDDLCNPPEDRREITRIWRNAVEKRYTSTGCDDPLVLSYTDPDCPIAHPRRRSSR